MFICGIKKDIEQPIKNPATAKPNPTQSLRSLQPKKHVKKENTNKKYGVILSIKLVNSTYSFELFIAIFSNEYIGQFV